jgi:hypothetical protein
MEEKDLREFSWTGLFIVTGCCFFLFSGVMKLLEGVHIPFFTWTGFASLLLGSLSTVGNLLAKSVK